MSKVKDREGPRVGSKQRRDARRKAVLRMIIYDGQHDTSSETIAGRLQEGRPELGITTRLVTYFRRRYSSIIHGTPRK